MLQWFIRFSEFNESSAPFRKNSNELSAFTLIPAKIRLHYPLLVLWNLFTIMMIWVGLFLGKQNQSKTPETTSVSNIWFNDEKLLLKLTCLGQFYFYITGI